MKSIWKSRLLSLFGFLLISIQSLGLFGITTNQDEAVLMKASSDRVEVYEVAVLGREIPSVEETVPETVPEPVETVPVVQPVIEAVPEPVVQQPVITNSISIGNVLYNHLMKDTTGDHFYLNHNLNGDYDGIGVPYIDFRTDFNTRKTIIYSHSSTQGNGPFQVLQNYHYNKAFYDQNPYITIHYEGRTYTYQIFSVYVSVANSEEDDGLEFFHRMYYTDSEWNERVNYYKSHSDYETGVSVSGSDKILILQTCSMDPNFYQKYYRYNLLIMGKLV